MKMQSFGPNNAMATIAGDVYQQWKAKGWRWEHAESTNGGVTWRCCGLVEGPAACISWVDFMGHPYPRHDLSDWTTP